MIKIDKKKIKLIAIVLMAVALTNGVLLYLYPKSFSAFVYILFIFVPLIAIVLVVFARFSLLFLKRIDEKEEEEKLLQERQREIVENMVEGLVVHKADGRILSVNGVAEKFLNIRYLDIKGKKVGEIENPSQLLRAIFMPMEDRKELAFSFKDDLEQELFYQIIQVPLSKERSEVLKIIRDVSRAKYLDRMEHVQPTTVHARRRTIQNQKARSRKKIPMASRWPLLANSLMMSGDQA